MQGIGMLPHTVLVPSRPQVLHIGFEGGMHEKDIKPAVRAAFMRSQGIAPEFHGTQIAGNVNAKIKQHKKGYGGWGHPADHEHCLKLLAKETKGSPGRMPLAGHHPDIGGALVDGFA